jgi:hypothetical protein
MSDKSEALIEWKKNNKIDLEQNLREEARNQ